jgi:hypothetical protein
MRSEMPFNFQFWLLESLVRFNEWGFVDLIIENVFEQGGLDLTMNFALLETITETLHWFVEPLYRSLSKGRVLNKNQTVPKNVYEGLEMSMDCETGVRQATSPAIFFEDIMKILKVLNFHISTDQILFQKVLTVISAHFNMNPQLSLKITGEILLPALALVENNNPIAKLIWDILSRTDVFARYEYYTTLLT